MLNINKATGKAIRIKDFFKDLLKKYKIKKEKIIVK